MNRYWQRTSRLLQTMSAALDTRPKLLLLLCVFLSISRAYQESARRPLWYDEIFTFKISHLPDLGSIWDALARGVDLQPPLFFLVTRVCHSMFGDSETVTRLPAIAGFALLVVSLSYLVKNRTSPLFGAVAVLFLMVSGAFRYAFEARPYGLVLGLTASALLCWQAASGRHRPLALAGLGLSLVCLVSSHYYAILVLIPLGMGELVRSLRNKRLDWAISSILLLSAMVVVPYLPLIRHAVSLYSAHAWNFPNLEDLTSPYSLILGDGFAAFTVLLLVLALSNAIRFGRTQWQFSLLPQDVAVLAGLLLLSVPAFVIARTAARMLTARYLLPIAVGIAWLFATALWEATRKSRVSALLVALGLGGWFSVGFIATPATRNPADTAANIRRWGEAVTRHAGQVPIVFDNGLEFLENFHYAPPELRNRFVYVTDSQFALHYVGSDSIDNVLATAAPFLHCSTLSWASLQSRHQQFVVVPSTSKRDWLMRKFYDDNVPIQFKALSKSEHIAVVTLPSALDHTSAR